MNPDARELIGILVLVVVLRELLPFLMNIIREKRPPMMSADAMLILQTQTGILSRLEAASTDHGKMLTENKYHAESIKGDTEHIRQGIHDLKGHDQVVIGLLKMRQNPRED